MSAEPPRPITVFMDADACPVKAEVYKVAARYAARVAVVANAPLRVPAGPLVELIVQPGFAAADDYIAAHAGPGDVVVTADIPLAARALEAGAAAADFKGRPFTESDIHESMAVRDLMRGLRADGTVTGGPAPMTPRDRSKFLSTLDQMLSASVRKRAGR